MDFFEYKPNKGSANSNLAAENESLKEQKFLLEKLLYAKNNHISVLEKMITELHARVCEADNQFEQLLDVRDKLDKIKSIFPEKVIYPITEDDDSIEGSLESLQSNITDMQSSLLQIQEQLLRLQESNLLLQQQNIRIGELESLLSFKTNPDA